MKTRLRTLTLRFRSHDTESTHPYDTSGGRTADLKTLDVRGAAFLLIYHGADTHNSARVGSDIDTTVEETPLSASIASTRWRVGELFRTQGKRTWRENGLLCGIASQRPSAMTLYVCNVGHPDDDRRSETFLPVRTDLSTRLTRVDPGVLGDL